MAESLREVEFRLARLLAARRELAAELELVDGELASARAKLFSAWIEERVPNWVRAGAAHG